ncbi:hypothetical protein [Clostridium sp.]|uniref:hypothetical protein n=1 Tax=Clostridium sp. TaxID=1506 RepID=UPI001DBA2EC5|nr:hypothetical protein [Clostridium sp.]MBS5987506.1 hypothetical protein [Clostridium sp.]
MSKRRHRDRSRESNNMGRNQGFGANSNNRFPFGINPQQLFGMLGGNIDMNRLGSMLNSMNMEGFDLNSMNQQMNNNNNGNTNMNGNNNNFNFESMMNAMSGMNMMGNHMDNKVNTENISKFDENSYPEEVDDENIQILLSLRKIVDPNKVQFVDKIIELYNNGAFNEK